MEILGAIKHSDVRSVLTRGHIFLNCSLTESFCIAILEAACCGLHVVSTNVGGVPEVLPPNDVTYADTATPDAVEFALDTVIRRVRNLPSPWEVHNRIRGYYSWHSVARRTVRVYDNISNAPVLGVRGRLMKYWNAMHWSFRLLVVWIVVLDWLWHKVLCWLWPEGGIEKAKNLDVIKWMSKGRREDERDSGGGGGGGNGNGGSGSGSGSGGKKNRTSGKMMEEFGKRRTTTQPPENPKGVVRSSSSNGAGGGRGGETDWLVGDGVDVVM